MAKETENNFVVYFELEKETPGAARYMETDSQGNKVTIANGAKLGTVYIRKSALPKKIPQAIAIAISMS